MEWDFLLPQIEDFLGSLNKPDKQIDNPKAQQKFRGGALLDLRILIQNMHNRLVPGTMYMHTDNLHLYMYTYSSNNRSRATSTAL